MRECARTPMTNALLAAFPLCAALAMLSDTHPDLLPLPLRLLFIGLVRLPRHSFVMLATARPLLILVLTILNTMMMLMRRPWPSVTRVTIRHAPVVQTLPRPIRSLLRNLTKDQRRRTTALSAPAAPATAPVRRVSSVIALSPARSTTLLARIRAPLLPPRKPLLLPSHSSLSLTCRRCPVLLVPPRHWKCSPLSLTPIASHAATLSQRAPLAHSVSFVAVAISSTRLPPASSFGAQHALTSPVPHVPLRTAAPAASPGFRAIRPLLF